VYELRASRNIDDYEPQRYRADGRHIVRLSGAHGRRREPSQRVFQYGEHDDDTGAGRLAATDDTGQSGCDSGSSSEVTLVWSASTDNVVVTSYLIERCQSPACTAFAENRDVDDDRLQRRGPGGFDQL
jgi:hypothetical protein